MRKPAILVGIAAVALIGGQGWAAESGTAQLSLVSTTAGPTYNYSISLDNTGTTTIGTFWFGWLPGQNFLPSTPSVTGNPNANWSNSTAGGQPDFIHWVATPGDELQAGATLSGFTFSSADSPVVLGGDASEFPDTPILTSALYANMAFTSTEADIVVGNVPEPATIGGVVLGISAIFLRRPKRA